MTVLTGHPAALRTAYQGWSGFVLSRSDEDGTPLVFDPAPEVALAQGQAVIAITHGHPEHIRGALAHMRLADRAPVSVVASPAICDYLGRRSGRNDDRFLPVAAGDVVKSHGWQLRVFGWRHMTLLPPGWGASLKHIARLVAHPIAATGIGLQSLAGPEHGPMLGFHVSGGLEPVVYLGEGLHRQTTQAELVAALGDTAAALIAGVEPEDVEQLPALLSGLAISRLMLFEPHRVWRERFGMAQANLPELAARLRGLGLAVDLPAVSPQETA